MSDLVQELKSAIDTNDVEQVKALMTAHPELHSAPLGYGKSGPLTWAAECRVPYEAPGPERLAMVRWMLENGSDVHQGDDGPLSRAALNGDRVAMMELLVSYGADVNAEWKGFFPILWSPCESVDPEVIRWLLSHGANPNTAKPDRPMSALDYLLGTYSRSSELPECIELLIAAGGTTRYDVPGVLDLLRERFDSFAQLLDANPALVHRRFPELDFGNTGTRRLLLQGATLLHVAAEFGSVEGATILLDRGADVNARADVDQAGVGGQTPIFHSVSQFHDFGLDVTKLLVERGADLTIRAKLPGYYEREDEFVDGTPLEYALRFPGDESETVALLRQRLLGT